MTSGAVFCKCINARSSSICFGALVQLFNSVSSAASLLYASDNRIKVSFFALYLSFNASQIKQTSFSMSFLMSGYTCELSTICCTSESLSSFLICRASATTYSLSLKSEKSSVRSSFQIKILSLVNFKLAGTAACITSPSVHI